MLFIFLNSSVIATVGKMFYHPKVVPSNLSRLVRYKSEDVIVSIADVSKSVKLAENPVYIPVKYLPGKPSQETLKHLKWMLQKDILNQDMFLMGGPGFKKRKLALAFLALTGRELEFITISRDTTEADLKQRREIESGTAYYHDQGAVRAAIHGRILVIEGVEKAERNVLPVLNNLLENREMHLEDGRFLIPASRYDKLLKVHSKQQLDQWRLIRVSDEFRVIALGLPYPRYQGHPLDPPLRSRFQARHISFSSYEEQLAALKSIAPNADAGKLVQFLSSAYALSTEEAVQLGLPDFPLDNLPYAVAVLDKCPHLQAFDVFYRLYPYKLFLGRDGRTAVEDMLRNFDMLNTSGERLEGKTDISVTDRKSDIVEITVSRGHDSTTFDIPCQANDSSKRASKYVETNYQNGLIADILESQIAMDICLIGPKGCGKSITIERLAELTGYNVEPVVLYQDMTSRDLIQQRTTLPNGDTVWRNSPLIDAALDGKLAVLDGIHRVHSSTLAVLHRLIHDREIQLHDGTRLLRADRYDHVKTKFGKTDEEMLTLGIKRINPAFRLISLAEPPNVNIASGQWLTSELLSMFLFHEMRPLDKAEEIHIIRTKCGEPSEALLNVIELAHVLRRSSDPMLEALAGSLSTRQLLRIAERMQRFKDNDAYATVCRACLSRFLPAVAKQALENSMRRLNIVPIKRQSDLGIQCKVVDNSVTIGSTTVKRYETTALSKVPDILFYDVPQHIALLESLLQDFTLGQNLLLVGNQGVGKNKIVDRLLQLMNRPREYIQLHRDTTVQTLTLQPMVRDGKVVYEDSPLVQAVKYGHVLVVDEADKAPTHVTCILKTLVESGEMILADGRRIVPSSMSDFANSKIIPIHPDFRLIVLANRPGFPFLGNDFFGALGDLFSTHSVDNPSIENEIQLLKQYGPDVDDKVIQKLVRAFGELRNMADEGLVSYPYSTREVVNIVKHLQKFPNEPLANVVRNVFDFDRYSQEIFDTLVTVLHKYGIPIGADRSNIVLAKEISLPSRKISEIWNPLKDEQKLRIQERQIKLKGLTPLKQTAHVLDRVETRSVWFTELQSFWRIPIGESALVAGLAATQGTSGGDKIHVLTMNPLTIFSMKLDSDEIQETYIQGLLSPERGSKPSYSIAVDPVGNVIVHEDTSNLALLVNVEEGSAQTMPLSSFFDLATERISQTWRNIDVSRLKMKADLISTNNQIVFFSPNGNKIEVVNLVDMSIYTITLPCVVNSVLLAADNKWLLEDTSNKRYILYKSSDAVPCPDVLQEIQASNKGFGKSGTFLNCSKNSMSDNTLSEALEQKISSPNRLLASDKTYAGIAVGFPELDSFIEFSFWPRKERAISSTPPIASEDGYVIRTVSKENVPPEVILNDRDIAGYLEVVNIVNHKVRYIPVPEPARISPMAQWLYSRDPPLFVTPVSNQTLVTVDAGGSVRQWEVSLTNIDKSLGAWRRMIGEDDENLQITKERYSGKDVTAPKHGKIDEKNEPHVGGNTWAGGTGGRDTAGLGGKGGPYRLDAGHNVHQLSDEEKNAVPEHIKKAAREMGMRAFQQRLKDIKMSEYDHRLYSQFSDAVRKQVQALRVILDSLQAKSKERQWMRHQTSGELDDTKLIEGLTGEKTIYRRRAEKDPEIGTPQQKPKRLKLVVDVSGSMYRFNSYDGRLEREMEACVMVMEAFSGYEGKLQYDIVGHSGDDYNIPFVDHTQPPADDNRRLQVVKTMHAHSQFCASGDHTLEATAHAIRSLAREDSDEKIVVLLSDANLQRYGIRPERFAKVLESDPEVKAYAIFIGSLGDEAARSVKKMPSGHAFVCMDLKDIPRILQQIFAASVLSTTRAF